MGVSIWGFISELVSPFAKVVDDVHTSTEEKLELKNKLVELQSRLSISLLEYEAKLVEAKSKVITAEAQGQSWLQRTWRPITMLTFLVLVVCDSFGWLPNRLAEQAWTLLQIGLGGYVVGRSAEKIAPKIVDMIKN